MPETDPQEPQHPTMSLIGANAASLGPRVFSRWAPILGLDNAQLLDVTIPADAPDDACRTAVEAVKRDPLNLGAFVASHRTELLHAAGNLFDDLSSDATLCDQVSCLLNYEDHLLAHTAAPEALIRALANLLGHGYWRRHRADLLCLGAGNAAVALLVALATRAMIDDRPRQLLLVDHDLGRLQHLERLARRLSTAEMAVQLIHNDQPEDNARLLANLPPRSLVVNATGNARALPADARFPRHGVAWDLGKGDDLPLLRHARAQAAERDLRVADGWDYYLSEWASVLGYVFGLTIDDPTYIRLVRAARPLRQTP